LIDRTGKTGPAAAEKTNKEITPTKSRKTPRKSNFRSGESWRTWRLTRAALDEVRLRRVVVCDEPFLVEGLLVVLRVMFLIKPKDCSNYSTRKFEGEIRREILMMASAKDDRAQTASERCHCQANLSPTPLRRIHLNSESLYGFPDVVSIVPRSSAGRIPSMGF
jgi:hypothetical protein